MPVVMPTSCSAIETKMRDSLAHPREEPDNECPNIFGHRARRTLFGAGFILLIALRT
jgi:hypothetical protein